MRKAGVHDSVIMDITGHSTMEMFQRYNTVDAEDTREALKQYGAFIQVLDKALDKPKTMKNPTSQNPQIKRLLTAFPAKSQVVKAFMVRAMWKPLSIDGAEGET